MRILIPIYLFMSVILNISEAASIAIHSMAIIAKSKEMLSVNKIAEFTGFSRNHLAKVMQTLVKNKFIKSIRGPKGGFLMDKNSKEISLLQIYESIEGVLSCFQCGIKSGVCPFKKCLYGEFPEKFSTEFKNYLSETSLYDIA